VSCLRLWRWSALASRLLLWMAGLVLLPAPSPAGPPTFNRDVRPILAQHCWRCHGFDPAERQGGLRLDVRTSAIEAADSGRAAIVPGRPEESSLIERVTSSSADHQMPPPDAARRLSASEVETLREWIRGGAEYEKHWSFAPIRSARPPAVPDAAHPIDAFVRTELPHRGLEPSPPADPLQLRRRVSFDLIGLPPTVEDLERIAEEPYEDYVDRLLSSPHFGERMAADWLDAARYADTDGYFGDKPREMWLWRDWVIDAFNNNMPFDQFTIEQLAGDLLPGASVRQRIATGFNRNHMSNDETGLIDEEYRVEYVVDRVETTMTTWLGLTVGCAQCHDHKFDPISQREYFQLFAFFNNVPEKGLLVGTNAPPRISVPSDAQQAGLVRLAAATAAAETAYEPMRREAEQTRGQQETEFQATLPAAPEDSLAAQSHFEVPLEAGWSALGTSLQKDAGIQGNGLKFDATQHLEAVLGPLSADGPWTIGLWMSPTSSLSCPLSRIEPEGNRRGWEVLWQKGRIVVHLVHEWGTNAIEVATRETFAAKQWHHLVITYDGSGRAAGLRLFLDGVPAAVEVRRDSLDGSIANAEPLRIGRRDEGLGYYGLLDELRILGTAVSPEAVADWTRSDRLRGILEKPAEKRSPQERDILLDDFIDRHASPPARMARDAVRNARAAEARLKGAIPFALVMDEMSPPRPTYVLERGQYDKRGMEVQPDVPSAVLAWPEGGPRNRLGLARWLVAPDNPMTARVAVNRLWRQCFGEGLVRTVNDFGTQGDLPTHPELLDFLAARFRDGGWDVKAMLRFIVTSQTYRQQSNAVLQQGEIVDPENRWLSRGARFRLPMEMIRDQALAASGLLAPRLGGPSVKPYQPPGLWEEVSYNGDESYVPDRGDGLWRRSLYTYIKRQSPPPSLLLFDGPTREKCTVRRPRTNTPLQALLLLNDETYVEAARHLAIACCSDSTSDSDRLTRLFRRVLSRSPQPEEASLFSGLLYRQRARFATEPQAAVRLLSVGTSERLDSGPAGEIAAWTVLAHTLLNLDEAVTRR